MQLMGPFPGHVPGQEGADVPLESTESGRSAPSGPFEQREGSKQQRADEAQPGSGRLTPKRYRLVVPG
jgi:hypothetical protein